MARKDAWSPKACTELQIPKVTTVSDTETYKKSGYVCQNEGM